MALQDILKKILLDADMEAENTALELEQKKKNLDVASKKLEEKELQALEAKTVSALASIEDKTRSMARREKARMLLEAKQTVIKELLQKFQAQLEGLAEKEYTDVIEKLFKAISETEGVIVTSTARIPATKKVAPTGMTIESDDTIKGGFVFKSKTGGEVDNSFASLVFSEFRSSLEMYFADQLKFI
jgi:vacuolar-type H+-ATPase subunit E/Vma4